MQEHSSTWVLKIHNHISILPNDALSVVSNGRHMANFL